MRARRCRGGLLAGLRLRAGGAHPRAGGATARRCRARIYVTGSTAAKPLLAEIGKLMAAQSPPVDGRLSRSGLVHRRRRDPVRDAGRRLRNRRAQVLGQHRASSSSATSPRRASSRTSGSPTCSRPPASSFRAACRRRWRDILGPVQAMTFVAHKTSVERAISAEAAYYVYGFGAQSAVSPWTYEGLIFRRDAQSGTQRMIAAAIGVPAERWKGTATTSSGDLLTRLGDGQLPRSVDRHPVGGGRPGQPRDGQGPGLSALRPEVRGVPGSRRGLE